MAAYDAGRSDPARIAAVEGRPGRDTIDPKILMALWLYATIDGVGSARKLDVLCKHHHAYRWLCGGVSVNYHMGSVRNARTSDYSFHGALTMPP